MLAVLYIIKKTIYFLYVNSKEMSLKLALHNRCLISASVGLLEDHSTVMGQQLRVVHIECNC